MNRDHALHGPWMYCRIPTISPVGTTPKERLSLEVSRLSPSTKTDLAGTTITIPSASLPSNREVLIILTGSYSGVVGGLAQVRLNVDGVAGNEIVRLDVVATNQGGGLAINQLITLTSGSDRIIKAEFQASSGTIQVDRTHITTLLFG